MQHTLYNNMRTRVMLIYLKSVCAGKTAFKKNTKCSGKAVDYRIRTSALLKGNGNNLPLGNQLLRG